MVKIMNDDRIADFAYSLSSANKQQFPLSIQAAIVDACFNRCVMCEHPYKQHSNMPIEVWLDFLEKASLNGLRSVFYTGGDPFAYSRINEVMQKHIDLNLAFGILCSGYIPKTVDLELLRSAEWVRASLDTVDDKKYAEIRGMTPLYRILDGIDVLLENGITVGLCPTLHNDNVDHIIDVVEYAISKNVGIDIKSAYVGTYPTDKIDWNIFDSYLDYKKLRLMKPTDIKFDKCNVGRFQIFVNSAGDIFPCCILGGDVTVGYSIKPFGNIRNNWSDTYNQIIEFSALKSAERPANCNMCTGRFAEMNKVAELINNDKKFF